MAKEIERKFLVAVDSYKSMARDSRRIVQAYLSTSKDATVRIRMIDNRAYITVKGSNAGCVRDEWEYEIPVADALLMIERCHLENAIYKTRHYVEYEGHIWEVDEFAGRLQGLVVAEIELDSPDEYFELPPFVDKEVTDNPKYFNSVLSTLSYPF